MFVETNRLLLRRFREEDFVSYCAYSLNQPEQDRMMGRCELDTVDAVRQNFNWLKDREPRGYVIVLKEENKVIGNLTVYDRTPVAHLDAVREKVGRSRSFCLSSQYRRRGLMEEAVRAVAQKLFDEENTDYIHCGCFDFNLPSLALQRKLGFQFLAKEVILVERKAYTGIENILWK